MRTRYLMILAVLILLVVLQALRRESNDTLRFMENQNKISQPRSK